MDNEELVIKLEAVTYDLEVFHYEENTTQGSAVYINEKGYLLTAAHNLVRLNHIEEDASNPGLFIHAKRKYGQFEQYKVIYCAPSIRHEILEKPIVIDLALLIPKNNKKISDYLEITEINPNLGEEVLLSGYSDELELPFSFDRLVDRRREDVQKQMDKLNILKRMLMIKRGIVGNIMSFDIGNTDVDAIAGKVFYIDNMMHFGASGGPIINKDGKIVGIIIKRAVTQTDHEDLKNIPVPSGSTMAITPYSINKHVRGLTSRGHR